MLSTLATRCSSFQPLNRTLSSWALRGPHTMASHRQQLLWLMLSYQQQQRQQRQQHQQHHHMLLIPCSTLPLSMDRVRSTFPLVGPSVQQHNHTLRRCNLPSPSPCLLGMPHSLQHLPSPSPLHLLLLHRYLLLHPLDTMRVRQILLLVDVESTTAPRVPPPPANQQQRLQPSHPFRRMMRSKQRSSWQR